MTQSEDDYTEPLMQGLLTGKIELPGMTITWDGLLLGDCLSNCRDFPGVGQIHQIGCPNVPPREVNT